MKGMERIWTSIVGCGVNFDASMADLKVVLHGDEEWWNGGNETGFC